MKVHDQIRVLKHYNAERRLGVSYAVDEELATRLPKLKLPTMNEEARGAFQALLSYEAPPANGSVRDTLALVEARGYTVHPCDWIPVFAWQYSSRHPEIYQPWVDYLSENDYTRFHSGNTLTVENSHRFAPSQRKKAFREYVRRYDPKKLEYAQAILKSQPAGVRAELLWEANGGGAFAGVYPWQVPFIQGFLEDKAASVRKIAQELLDWQGGWASEETYSQIIASHMKATDTCVTWREPPERPSGFLFKEFRCATFEGLADALGLTSVQLAERVDLELLDYEFNHLAASSGDLEVRSIIARRALDEGRGAASLPYKCFEGVNSELWRRGLESLKNSVYVNSVQDYLGEKTGTMSTAEMLEWGQFKPIQKADPRHLKKSSLPRNNRYDPLRYLGKVVDKEAAKFILDETINRGMEPQNPRLTMLRLNLSL